MDSEISIKAVNSKPKESASKKPWTWDRVMTDCLALTELLTNVAKVPPILMVGIKLASYTTKRSDRTLTGATLEMEILSQCGESNLQDFKTSSMNHGKGSVVGQLIPVEYYRLTVSEAAGGYMEVALENKNALEGYLETMMQGTTLKQKAYGTLVSSELHEETIEQLVSIPWRAVVLRYFEDNNFLSEDVRDCFFDYEQAVLLRFWTSRIATIKGATNPQTKLGLILEEKVTAPSVPKSDKRVEFGLGFSDKLLGTSLMVVWELMKPSWFPSPNADSILRATQDVQRELNSCCNLRDLNITYSLMTPSSKSNGEDKVELPGWGLEDWAKPGSCLAEVSGLQGHICGCMDCVKTLEKQHKQLTILFENTVMKAKTETELIADCHGGTQVNLVNVLGFHSMFGSLESLLNLEQKHEMVTAISVKVFPGVLQTEQNHIGNWREAIEAEMNIQYSDTYRRPTGARYLVGSTLASM